jgi:hypothetical protein
MSSRESIECCVGQIKRTLINVENIQTVPENTLVIDSNLAVVNCIETNANVCIGIVDITGNVNEQSAPLLGSAETLAAVRETWSQARSGTRGPRGFSNHLLSTIEGPTGEFAPQLANNVLIGREVAVLGQTFSNIAIGDQTVGSDTTNLIGLTGVTGYEGGQGEANVAIGYQAAFEGQFAGNIAIGAEPAAGGQFEGNIAIGNPASFFQDTNNISIGVFSAFEQNSGNIAIGDRAANSGQDVNAIAIGYEAAAGAGEGAVQSSYSIAIGSSAGADADPVPEYSIQLGYQSNVLSNYEPEGLSNVGIAIGPNSSSSEGALVLNTDISGLTGSGPGFFVQPIRDTFNTTQSSHRVLSYDTTSSEVIYNTQILSGTSQNGVVNGTIQFSGGSNFFFNTPRIVATPISGTGVLYGVNIYNITRAGFDFISYYVTDNTFQNSTAPFNWIAIGDTVD